LSARGDEVLAVLLERLQKFHAHQEAVSSLADAANARLDRRRLRGNQAGKRFGRYWNRQPYQLIDLQSSARGQKGARGTDVHGLGEVHELRPTVLGAAHKERYLQAHSGIPSALSWGQAHSLAALKKIFSS